MKRVTGIGGIFFKAREPDTLRSWYKEHLGLPVESWGGTQFHWRRDDAPDVRGSTVWTLFKGDTHYFDPSDKPFMINYRVENLAAVVAALKSEGVAVDDKIEETEYGRFAWLMDPEGNRVELWEPPEEKVEEKK